MSASSYIFFREPTKTCPTVAILDIMIAGRKKLRDFITQFRFFFYDARNDDDIQRIGGNAWIFAIDLLVMAIFEMIKLSRLGRFDFYMLFGNRHFLNYFTISGVFF